MTLRQITLVAAAAAAFSTSAARAEGCAQVEVQNVRPDHGMLMVAAYGGAADYKKKPAASMQVRPSAATLRFSVCGLGGPAVALSMYQDLNSNGKLDANLLGIPSEPWGATGKPSNFAAPSWDSTQVALDGSVLVVKLSQ
ncbi:DUF2141 domain-containing protein [Piscinibacter sp.]|jgi:uncharacterized protein (DUF2141 family)|uniref:DUF2141 domain-containing protein n=1 Tax=Piscinibacter sp. TaxID=1903157 RepID=UPI003559820D